MESDLTPYSSCLCIPARAVLVLAPHPDDEVFGCGGAIASHVKLAQPVCVVVLTDGALYGDATMRQLESYAAAAVLGYGLPEFWGFPDRGLAYSEVLVQRLANKISAMSCDLVYAPSPWEIHPDHRQTHMLAVEAVRRSGPEVRLAFYEVGSPLKANLLVDLTPVMAIKEAAMRCFESQLQQQDYVGHIQALNRFRSYTLPREVLAAEAYWVLTARTLDQTWRAGWLPVAAPGGAVDLASMANMVADEHFCPLVSVLVRCADSRFLSEALDSVALQVYPNIEVLVAHVGAAALPQKCGPFALRSLLCNKAWGPGEMANHLMAQAKGAFLLFLDEDDWLLPEHVARLSDVLVRQPHTLAVFTGVRVAEQAGWPTGEIYEHPFDSIQTLAAVEVPSHAVLFSQKLRDLNCQFDNTWGACADWHFWVGVGEKTLFTKLVGASAVRRNRDGRALLGAPVVAPSPDVRHRAQSAVQRLPDPVAAPVKTNLKTKAKTKSMMPLPHQNHRGAPSNPVVVSVLIRTMNRTSLTQAIASVAAQSFDDWEMLVVNASGQPLSPLRNAVARQVARFIEPGCALGRSAAANALLDVASGKYAVFLDDDDALEPLHLQKLVESLEANSEFVACYSDVVATIAGDGKTVESHVYACDYDATLLQLQNYLPIHSVMFRLDAARRTAACRFDEALPLFEDWDFWLQLAEKGVFRRVEGVSALYALNSSGGSGHAIAEGELRQEALLKFSNRQLERWGAAGVARLIGWQSQQIQDQQQVRQMMDSLQTQLSQASQVITRMTHQLDNATLGTVQLAAQLSGAKTQCAHVTQEKSILTEHLAQAAQEKDTLTEQLAQAAREKNTLTDRLAQEKNILTEQLVQAAQEKEALTAHLAQEKDTFTQHLAQAGEEKNTLAEHLALITQEKDSITQHLAQTAQEKDSLVCQLNQARVMSHDLTGSVLSLQAQSQQHEQTSIVLEKTVRGLRTSEFSQHIELEKLSRLRLEHLQTIHALNLRLQATHQSRSWRFTRPLRGVKRVWNWLQTPKPLRLVRHGLLAVKNEVRRHGWLGFARRLPHFLRHSRTYVARLTSPAPEAKVNAAASLFSVQSPEVRALRLHPELNDVIGSIQASISVVIPTFNAGTEFKWLLRKLHTQQGLKNLEVVIVDSGSSDHTVLWARQAGCTVIEITQAEFTHSHARNLGAANASSDYVLFMVQDAYPVGNYWAYGMLRYLLDHADSGLVAASCSEYSRSDSDMMYDSMINTHYRFLGCDEQDRIGDYQGSDHMALRSRGQLSDVACLISRAMFAKYGYQGDYAEDLDLGIRLIKDGHKVAMLASVKVVHSHNRTAFYYLKRSYVDVIFLVGMFEDFTFAPVDSVPGLIAGIVSGARHVSDLLPALHDAAPGLVLSDVLAQWMETCKLRCNTLKLDGASATGDVRLDGYVDGLAQRLNAADMDSLAHGQAQRFMDSFFARLAHFNTFAADVYGPHDAGLRDALQHVVRKTFAAAAGSALGFMYMDKLVSPGVNQAMVDTINKELRAGV